MGGFDIEWTGEAILESKAKSNAVCQAKMILLLLLLLGSFL